MSLAISVIAANYNNAEYLTAFVESINSGSLIPAEIVLVDDASTDNSAEILQKLAGSHANLRMELLSKNIGVANARNLAISLATSDLLAIADPDDLILPERLRLQRDYLSEHSGVMLVGSNAGYFRNDSPAGLIARTNFPLSHSAIKQFYRQGRNGLLNGTITARREVFKQFKFDQSAVWAEDYHLFGRIVAANLEVAALPNVLMKVRIHESSATSNLQVATVKKIYQYRAELFGIKTSKIRIWREFLHLSNYRKALGAGSQITRLFYLIISSVFAPEKVLRKLLGRG